MQISLTHVSVNGEDPDPEVFQIGFGTWPQKVDTIYQGVQWVMNIWCDPRIFSDYSVIVQRTRPTDYTSLNCTGTLLDNNGLKTNMIMSEVWEIREDV